MSLSERCDVCVLASSPSAVAQPMLCALRRPASAAPRSTPPLRIFHFSAFLFHLALDHHVTASSLCFPPGIDHKCCLEIGAQVLFTSKLEDTRRCMTYWGFMHPSEQTSMAYRILQHPPLQIGPDWRRQLNCTCLNAGLHGQSAS